MLSEQSLIPRNWIMTPSQDILERLKATTKINGAYPRDIQDAINEIEWNRSEIASLLADIAEYAEAYSELSQKRKT
jgi:hypothetical protein